MSKLAGELSYKDWMIIKHGVKNSLQQKELILILDDLISWEPNKLEYKKRKQFEKEVAQERKTLERITKLTGNFKRYIKGKERHYMHRPNDCD